MHKQKISIFWFRRDLRLEDNVGLTAALTAGVPVLAIFIFDKEILSKLPKDDARVTFIYETLQRPMLENEILKLKTFSLSVELDLLPIKIRSSLKKTKL